MITLPKVYVGVDVSKNTLDIHIHPLGKSFKIENSKIDINNFLKKFTSYEVMQIACEATGGYERLFVNLSKKSKYRVWIVDPRRIKGFIVASGCKGKTDKIDAQKIAEFASKNSPDYQAMDKSENQEKLQVLVNRKNDLIQFLGSEKTRLQQPSHIDSIKSIKRFIKIFEKEIKLISDQIQSIIKKDVCLKKQSEILESIPGIGKTTTAALLSFVPELGTLNKNEISALVGLCPYDNQSGRYAGRKRIRAGRSIPRKALYMCALTSIKYSLIHKAFYDRLIAKNKPFKIAIVAVMHKLIILANSLLKKGELCKI
jgi:transposase